jgi:hypothetical protein
MPRAPSEQGQASVELVALLPLIVLIGAVLWQAVLAGETAWVAGSAARAAARAQALGKDPAAAARRILPARLARGVHVVARGDGSVTVAIPVPRVLGGGRLATIATQARFVPQSR